MRIESKRIIWIISVLLVLTVTFFSVILCVVIIFSWSNSFKNTKTETYDYQLTEISTSNDKTRFGIVTISQRLKNEEYISYPGETGSTFIISNFGGKRFECRGSCYCSDLENESRRIAATSSHLLSRGLMVLISAFSSSMAIRLAKDTFQNACVQKYSDVCNPTHVISETDDCDGESEQVFNLETIDVPGVENTDDLVEVPHDFNCKGKCVSYSDLGGELFEQFLPSVDRWEYIIVGKDRIGDCEDLKLERQFTMNIPGGFEAFVDGDESVTVTAFAVQRFQEELNEFCENFSQLSPEWFQNRKFAETFKDMAEKADEGDAKKKFFEWGKEGIPFCFGYELGFEEGAKGPEDRITEKNIRCAEVFEL